MANYNISKMITSGREIMANNPKRDITLIDMARIRDTDTDVYIQLNNAVLSGVALGVRICNAKRGEINE